MASFLTGPDYYLNARSNREAGRYSPTKARCREATHLNLTLTNVIGTTTTTPAGFACAGHCFAVLAGAIATLYDVDADGRLQQRFFRAQPSESPAQKASTQDANGRLGTPEATKYSSASPLTYKNVPRLLNSPSPDIPSIAPKLSARQRTRAANCVALSHEGNLLAIGEVKYEPSM